MICFIRDLIFRTLFEILLICDFRARYLILFLIDDHLLFHPLEDPRLMLKMVLVSRHLPIKEHSHIHIPLDMSQAIALGSQRILGRLLRVSRAAIEDCLFQHCDYEEDGGHDQDVVLADELAGPVIHRDRGLA
jgi:hypothetical protein